LLLIGVALGERRLERIDLVARRRNARGLAQVEQRKRRGDHDGHQQSTDVNSRRSSSTR